VESPTLAQPTRANYQNLVTIVSVIILIGTEVFGVALAGAWAIAGLFDLGETIRYILMGLFSLLGLYAMISLWRQAVTIEPISGR
jgi:hypothetical protein